ncbi:DUF3048 domain-containing protein [Candidatus Uhrbacteria bacterium]|nr:DUF3048 domain-containing protein [Candidatus Uhrbacteria bacterium]
MVYRSFSAKGGNHAFKILQRSQRYLVPGIVLLLLSSAGLFYLILSGKTRSTPPIILPPDQVTTSTVNLVPRRLDGMLVPVGQELLAPRAVMIENEINARPLSGLSQARVVIEAPVEGGITRFLAMFDASSTVAEIGPIRSARPYFVDWARAWNSIYFHVGGSPEALSLIQKLGNGFHQLDEITAGQFFWRSVDRTMPHNTYINHALMEKAAGETNVASSTMPVVWHFQDVTTSTKRGGIVTVKITYGGPYTVTWKFDPVRDLYTRFQGNKSQNDQDGTAVESENVIVIKTEAQVLDKIGRLKLRTIGSGEALVYRDGNRYAMRWRRGLGEPIKFEGTDGTEILLNRGRTWIEVTTDDRVFAGLEK